MINDPIVEEIRDIRHKLAEKFNNNLGRIVADLQQQERDSGRKFITLPKRPISPSVLPPLDTINENQPTQPSE